MVAIVGSSHFRLIGSATGPTGGTGATGSTGPIGPTGNSITGPTGYTGYGLTFARFIDGYLYQEFLTDSENAGVTSSYTTPNLVRGETGPISILIGGGNTFDAATRGLTVFRSQPESNVVEIRNITAHGQSVFLDVTDDKIEVRIDRGDPYVDVKSGAPGQLVISTARSIGSHPYSVTLEGATGTTYSDQLKSSSFKVKSYNEGIQNILDLDMNPSGHPRGDCSKLCIEGQGGLSCDIRHPSGVTADSMYVINAGLMGATYPYPILVNIAEPNNSDISSAFKLMVHGGTGTTALTPRWSNNIKWPFTEAPCFSGETDVFEFINVDNDWYGKIISWGIDPRVKVDNGLWFSSNLTTQWGFDNYDYINKEIVSKDKCFECNQQDTGGVIGSCDNEGVNALLGLPHGISGACCMGETEGCVITNPTSCGWAGGIFLGVGSTCGTENTNCETIGACCYINTRTGEIEECKSPYPLQQCIEDGNVSAYINTNWRTGTCEERPCCPYSDKECGLCCVCPDENSSCYCLDVDNDMPMTEEICIKRYGGSFVANKGCSTSNEEGTICVDCNRIVVWCCSDGNMSLEDSACGTIYDHPMTPDQWEQAQRRCNVLVCGDADTFECNNKEAMLRWKFYNNCNLSDSTDPTCPGNSRVCCSDEDGDCFSETHGGGNRNIIRSSLSYSEQEYRSPRRRNEKTRCLSFS